MLSTRPFLVDGRPLLPSLPSHRTLSADTLWTRPFFVDGRPLLPSLPSHRTLYADIRSRLGLSSSMAVRCSLRCLPIVRSPLIRSGLGPSSSMGVRCSLRCLPIARSTLIYALDSAFPRRWPSTSSLRCLPITRSLLIRSRLGPSSSMAVNSW